MSTAAKSPTALAIAVRTQDSVVILTADGALDSSSSALLRDSLTRATLEQPSAVIVNVTELQVAEESAWSVFISARWQADFRADVPVLLVCGHRAGRAAVTRTGVARFMPVYPTEKAASKAIGRLARRNFKRSDAQLPANLNSLRESRRASTFPAWRSLPRCPAPGAAVPLRRARRSGQLLGRRTNSDQAVAPRLHVKLEHVLISLGTATSRKAITCGSATRRQ